MPSSPEDIARFIGQARASFNVLRWLALVALTGLPFTFSDGILPFHLIVGAAVVGAVWLALYTLGWRRRQNRWLALAFALLLFSPRWFGVFGNVSKPMEIQWICLVVLVAGAPLLFFPAKVRALGRLEEAARDTPTPD